MLQCVALRSSALLKLQTLRHHMCKSLTVLRCVAVQCSKLRFVALVAVCDGGWQRAAALRIAQQCIAVCCSVLQCVTVCCCSLL